MASSILLGEARRVLVTEDAEQEADKIPYADENTVVAPIARLCNHLRVEDGRAKGQNGHDHKADILATILDGYNFSGSCECDEFVQASTNTREHISS